MPQPCRGARTELFCKSGGEHEKFFETFCILRNILNMYEIYFHQKKAAGMGIALPLSAAPDYNFLTEFTLEF